MRTAERKGGSFDTNSEISPITPASDVRKSARTMSMKNTCFLSKERNRDLRVRWETKTVIFYLTSDSRSVKYRRTGRIIIAAMNIQHRRAAYRSLGSYAQKTPETTSDVNA